MSRGRKYRLLKFIRDHLVGFFVIALAVFFIGPSLILESLNWFTIWSAVMIFAVSLFVSLLLVFWMLCYEDELWHLRQEELEEQAKFFDAEQQPKPDTASDKNVIDAINRVRRRREQQE